MLGGIKRLIIIFSMVVTSNIAAYTIVVANMMDYSVAVEFSLVGRSERSERADAKDKGDAWLYGVSRYAGRSR